MKSFGDFGNATIEFDQSRDLYLRQNNSRIINSYASKSFKIPKLLQGNQSKLFEHFSPDINHSKRQIFKNNLRFAKNPEADLYFNQQDQFENRSYLDLISGNKVSNLVHSKPCKTRVSTGK